jgi:hypothetical protein
MMRRCFWCLLCSVLLCTATAAAQSGVTLQATAGIGGMVKTARWVPVRVSLTNTGPALTTDLVVSWGDASVRRRVALAAAARRDVEVYIRSAAPTGRLRIHLESSPERGIDLPLRVAALEETVTLCVAAAVSNDDPARCSAVVAPEQLPFSWRGYEAADEILISGQEPVHAAQRVALAQARALRQLDAAGDLALTSQVAQPVLRRGLPAAASNALVILVSAYAALLLLIGAVAAVRAPAAPLVWIAAALLSMGAVGAALAVGRVGEAGHVHIHQAALLQQLPAAPGTLLTVRGIAQFPAPSAVSLRLDAADAVLQTRAGAPQTLDEDGRPVLTGRFGLGARQAFVAEGVVARQLLRVEEPDGRTVRISNDSGQALTHCGFSYGFSVADVGVLQPGESVTATHAGDVLGPAFTCRTLAPLAMFSTARHRLTTSGDTTVAVYLTRGPRDAGGDE